MANAFTRLRNRAADWLSSGGPAYRERLDEKRQHERLRARLALFGSGTDLSAVHDPTIAQSPTGGQHPILQLTKHRPGSGIAHGAQLLVFHAMREYLPTLDSAITNRRALEGDITITSEDEGLQDALEDFADEVAVGYVAGNASRRGLNTYVHKLADMADEYGLSAGEIVADERGTEIERLVVPSSRTLSLEQQQTERAAGGYLYRLKQHQDGRTTYLDDKPLVQVLSFTHGGDDAWPRPMAWSLVKSGEILLRIMEAVENGWWRFGDPSLLNAVEYGDAEAQPDMAEVGGDADGSGGQSVPQALLMLKNSMETVMNARRDGKVGDVYAFTGPGGELKSEVIGDIDASLMRYFGEHRQEFQADIIGASETPVWMYPSVEQSADGLSGARSNNQAGIYASAAMKRNRRKMALAKQVLDTFLLVSGDARYVGQYGLGVEAANLIDEKLVQEARKTQAEADQLVIANSFELYNSGFDTNEDDTMRTTEEQEQYLRNHDVIQ